MAKSSQEWKDYVATMPSTEDDGSGEFGLQSDITSFFASISPDRILEITLGRIGGNAAHGVIAQVINTHHALTTRSGLPQRSFASAVLAHLILRPVDEAIGLALADGRITAARRWMDDVSAEGTREQLYALSLAIQHQSRAAGLEINSAKTFLMPKHETAANMHLEALVGIEVPMEAVMDGYTNEETFRPNFQTLMELEDELLTSPKEFPRPLIRAVLVSLTKNMEFSREAEWRSRAHDFAHAADALGRYLRGASVVDPGLWWEYADWFHGFDRSLYGALDWVSSQYALMFPSFHLQGQVVEILRRWLTDSSDLQQVAVATQRLAATDPALARAVIRRRIDEAADPLIVRTFALGLLMTGEIDLARGALRRDPRNRLLIRMLDRTDWTTPPASEDFDPPDPPKTPFPL